MQLAVLAVFGVLGVLARYGVGKLFLPQIQGLMVPLATFGINILGSFLIGAVYVVGLERNLVSQELRIALMTGLIGGFTTFSAVSLEAVNLFEQGHTLQAMLYPAVGALIGVLAAACGVWLTRSLLG